MDLLVSCLVLPTPKSWENMLRDFALQWKSRPLIHLHLRGSGPGLDQCLSALADLTRDSSSVGISVGGECFSFKIDLHSGYSDLPGVHTVVWLERSGG